MTMSQPIIPLPWMDGANCTQVTPDTFFPEGKGAMCRDAKLICRGCDVKAECLAFALTTHQYYGVWGGLSERERRRLRPIVRREVPERIGLYPCAAGGCDYFGPNPAALAKHRERMHRADEAA